jgi:phosphoribosylanthranilate isomerase
MVDSRRLVRAKVCGLTRAEDAATAVAAGADYLGVVFAGGPRRVTPQAAADIRAAADGVPLFGVFGDQSVDEILRIARAAGLQGVQLHGDYGRTDAGRLRAEGLLVWRVAWVADRKDLALLSEMSMDADAVLVEPRVVGLSGGTGIRLALGLAQGARSRLAGAPMVLAGGLTPESVVGAMALVRPDIVDVSSGVERLPGIKDPDKIARFLEAVVGHSAIS